MPLAFYLFYLINKYIEMHGEQNIKKKKICHQCLQILLKTFLKR